MKQRRRRLHLGRSHQVTNRYQAQVVTAAPNARTERLPRGCHQCPDLEPDRALDNADWLREIAWDLTTPAPECRIVRTLGELRAALGDGGPATDEDLVRFLGLPAARAMPDGLRAEVRARLSAKSGGASLGSEGTVDR